MNRQDKIDNIATIMLYSSIGSVAIHFFTPSFVPKILYETVFSSIFMGVSLFIFGMALVASHYEEKIEDARIGYYN